MNKEKSIAVLNTLIEINNDRIEGYTSASKETKETELKSVFSKFANTSEKCREELVSEVKKLGGTPAKGTTTTGKFFRIWMDVKAALTLKDRESILNSCEYGEDNAVDTYKKELKDNVADISPAQLSMLKAQLELIEADHDEVKQMRDVVEHK